MALAALLAGGLAVETRIVGNSDGSSGHADASATTSSATTTPPISSTTLPPGKHLHVHAIPGSYATEVGITPANSACGDTNLQNVAAAMDAVVATGVTMIRCDLSWWTVQDTGPTAAHWEIYDNAVNVAHDAGVAVLFVPQFTPPWAEPKPLPPGSIESHVPPVHASDYANFVQAAVQRYSPVGKQRPPNVRGSVSLWELWNEPNIPGFWNPPDPAGYAALLRATAPAIKQIDPKATVISGGLAPAANKNKNIAPDTFLKALATTGALSVVDAVGIHPYTFPAWPNENVVWNPMIGIVPRMHNAMVNAGVGNKKIWATELGWPTSSTGTQTIRDDGTQVGTERFQALMLPALVNTWFHFSYAGPMIVYELQDKCDDQSSWFCTSGVERLNGTHKPGYDSLLTTLSHKIGT